MARPVDRMRPVHPGEVLREDDLVPLGLSVNALSTALGVPATRIHEIVRERRAVTADTAARLATHFERCKTGRRAVCGGQAAHPRRPSAQGAGLDAREGLGNVYAWAGQERSVQLGKGGFQFATAGLLPGLLRDFERKYLMKWTPCGAIAPDAVVNAIAVTHVELILIHPFREGNGRLSRLLADVMAVQAGHEPLDYSSWEQNKPAYIGAIHAGLAGDYGPMTRFVAEAMAAGDASLSGLA